MLLAALLPIRDACPLYYPQKSAEPAPTKRLRAFLGTEAALGAAVAATALLTALFMRALLIATSTYAIFALLGVSSLRRVDLSLVSGLSLSVRSSTRPPRAPGLHPHGEPTPCSSHTAQWQSPDTRSPALLSFCSLSTSVQTRFSVSACRGRAVRVCGGAGQGASFCCPAPVNKLYCLA